MLKCNICGEECETLNELTEEHRICRFRKDRRRRYEDLTPMLPTEAYYKGFRLSWENPEYNPDPVILKGYQGEELYRWEYIPSLGEVLEICQRFLY